jgi:hypothetical protein
MILFAKAIDDEHAAIERQLDGVERRYRRIIADWLERVKDEETISAVREALERGNVEQAVEIINDQSDGFRAPIYEIMIGAAIAESARLKPKITAITFIPGQPVPTPAIGVTFNPGNPRAEAVLRETTETFIREIDQSTSETIFETLRQAQQTGASPAQMARDIQRNLGLTKRQLEAVENYRRLLEAGSKEALDRELRDRRFDPSVRRARTKPLTPAQIERMVERYREKAIANRAITIARTESLSAMNKARLEAFRQGLEQAGIDPSRATKEWLSSRDARVRDQHVTLDGQKVAIDQPFVAPNGDRLLTPGDRSLGARASNVVNCRCSAIFSVN